MSEIIKSNADLVPAEHAYMRPQQTLTQLLEAQAHANAAGNSALSNALAHDIESAIARRKPCALA